MKRGAKRKAAAGAVVVAAALVLSGCGGSDTLADEYREGSGKGFIQGEFQVVEIAPDERDAPVEFSGVTEQGDAVSSDDYAGDVLVVNFWYAACGPCIAEAPYLEEVAERNADAGVSFLGINIYDQAPTAISFARDNGVSYPSIIDVNDGRAKLAFAQVTPIQATPTTLVIDREGRVAARIIGQLHNASILDTLVRDTVAEQA